MEDLKNLTTENVEVNKIKNIFQKASDAFHKMGLWILISIAIGVYIGVTTCKAFYVNKLSEVVKIGGMLHQEKVYIVSPK